MPNLMHIAALAIVALGAALAWRARKEEGPAQGPNPAHSQDDLPRCGEWLRCIERLTGSAAICLDPAMRITEAGGSASSLLRAGRGSHLIDAAPKDARAATLAIASRAMRDDAASGRVSWAGTSVLMTAASAGADRLVISISHGEDI
ncbi:MAG: hypothetical protein JXA24_07285 [Proteobacteria bacterium]|nr:hypothetical protein [Pseudomonadota bacterium]